MRELLLKIKEALLSALPIIAIVYIFSATPLFNFSAAELVAFSVSSVLLIVGLGLFNLGADLAMTPMGNLVGSGLSKQKKLGLLLAVCFVLGVLITIAEPDLQVLASQVSTIMNSTALIVCVGIGVGGFLILGVLRIVFKRELSNILLLFYMLIFALGLILTTQGKEALLPLALDSGGVTTGPITVPFILALGVGISRVLSDRRAKDDSFGLVSLCSIGPILAVMVLSIFADNSLHYTVADYSVSEDVLGSFLSAGAHVAKEVSLALGMIILFFLICQLTFLRLSKKRLMKIGLGILFTYLGLVMFLTSVNVGFMPIGYKLGIGLAQASPVFMVIFGAVVGILVVLAEPAIHVLKGQVEEVSGGTIRQSSMVISLCTGVGISIALSVIRIIFDFSVIYYIIPGYFISLCLTLFVPPMYTAIAFDSGGVASGPMTSCFILPFAIGACVTLQGADAVMQNAFGVVAMVAMTPLITIQLLGFRAVVSTWAKERRAMQKMLDADDQQIINFMWEV